MEKTSVKFESINQYIKSFPKETQIILESIRKSIKKIIPDSEETISYNIPTFKINGKYLIYFAGFKTHIGVYPVHPADYPFAKELQKHISGKATLKFPLNRPIPFDLIQKVVKSKAEKISDLPKTAAPALRALGSIGISKLKDLTKFRELEIKELHGMGPKALETLKKEMKKHKLQFKK